MDSYITYDENGQKIRIILHTRCPNCKSDDTEQWDEHLEELYCGKCGLVMEAPYCPDLVFPGKIIWTEQEHLTD